MVCAARTQADIEAVADEVRALGRPALAVPTDVMQTRRPRAPGRRRRRPVRPHRRPRQQRRRDDAPRLRWTPSERYFETALRFNVTAPFVLSRLAARRDGRHRGRGQRSSTSRRGRATWCRPASWPTGRRKAALNMMTRNIAAELAPRVRVNAISVGGVATQGLEVVLTDDDLRRQFEDGHADGPPGHHRGHRLRRALPRVARRVVGDRKVFQVDGGTEAPAISVPVAAARTTLVEATSRFRLREPPCRDRPGSRPGRGSGRHALPRVGPRVRRRRTPRRRRGRAAPRRRRRRRPSTRTGRLAAFAPRPDADARVTASSVTNPGSPSGGN